MCENCNLRPPPPHPTHGGGGGGRGGCTLWTDYKDTPLPSYRFFNFMNMQHTKDTFPFIFHFLSFLVVYSIATQMLFTKQMRKAINSLL